MKIEVEITNDCNYTCNSCSIHKGLIDVSDTYMSINHIDKLINDIITTDCKISYIHIMGGEPTIHPLFEDIVNKIHTELYQIGKIDYINIVSNGIIPISDRIKNLPGIIISIAGIEKSQRHRCQWVAPIDTGQEQGICTVPYDCGISYNKEGYYPCGAGGAIARLFKLDKFKKSSIPIDEKSFGDLSDLCCLCQASAINKMETKYFGNIISKSFRDVLTKQ